MKFLVTKIKVFNKQIQDLMLTMFLQTKIHDVAIIEVETRRNMRVRYFSDNENLVASNSRLDKCQIRQQLYIYNSK